MSVEPGAALPSPPDSVLRAADVPGVELVGPWYARWLAVPTPAAVWLSAIPLALSVGSIFAPAVSIPVLALDLVLVLVALADLAASGGRVRVARSFAPVQAVGRAFPIQVTLGNDGARTLLVVATDDGPGTAEGLPFSTVLAAGERAERVYQRVVDQRGRHDLGGIAVRFRSPLGLWSRQTRFAVPGQVRVYPDFARLRETGFRGRLSEQKAPHQARRRPGGENEFQRLRPYAAGDPYRHIDWKATARKREFVTREYGQESNQNLIFLLDCGRMMSERFGGLTAFDHALNAAILLGQVALKHGDRVGLLAFDRKIRAWLPPKGGARSSGRLIRATYDLEPTLEEPDYALAFRHLTHHVRRRSLVVVLTSVIDEVNGELASSLVRALGSRHLALCAQVRDTDVDALIDQETADPRDPYVRAAAAELAGWRERMLATLRKRGALVVDCAPDELTPGLLHRYLEVKARRLL